MRVSKYCSTILCVSQIEKKWRILVSHVFCEFMLISWLWLCSGTIQRTFSKRHRVCNRSPPCCYSDGHSLFRIMSRNKNVSRSIMVENCLTDLSIQNAVARQCVFFEIMNLFATRWTSVEKFLRCMYCSW